MTPAEGSSTQPRTIAWFSWKGGVGRSMSLANVAHLLALSGHKVGVVDLDIEAPGLHLIAPFRTKGEGRSGGLLTALRDFWMGPDEVPADGSRSNGTRTEILAEEQPLKEHLARHRAKVPVPGAAHAISFLPAGPADMVEYMAALEVVKRLDYYADPSGERAPIEGSGVPLAESMQAVKHWFLNEEGVDFLLIDSRTGASDFGGISAMELADIVVFVSGMNVNHRAGVESFFRLYDHAKAGPEFDASHFTNDSEFTHRSPIIPVVTVTGEGETLWKAEALGFYENRFRGCQKQVTVPYWGGACFYAESVIGQPFENLTPAGAYRQLADRIVELSGSTPKQSGTRALVRRIARAEAILAREPKSALAHYGLAQLLWDTRDRKREAAEHAKAALQLDGKQWWVARDLAKWHLTLAISPGSKPTDYPDARVYADRAFDSLLQEERDERTEEALLECLDVLFGLSQRNPKLEAPEATLRRVNLLFDRFGMSPDGEPSDASDQWLWRRLAIVRAKCLDLAHQVDQALAMFERLAKMFPSDEVVIPDYITFLSRNGKTELYREVLRDAVRNGISLELNIRRSAELLLAEGGLNAALDFLSNYVDRRGPVGVAAKVAAATCYWRFGQYREASDLFTTALDEDPASATAAIGLGDARLQLGDGEGALRLSEAVLERERLPEALRLKFRALVRLGRQEEATSVAEEILHVTPATITASEAREMLSAAYGVRNLELAQSMYEIVQSQARQGEEGDGQRFSAALLMAGALILTGKPDDPRVEELIEGARQLRVDSHRLHAIEAMRRLYLAKSLDRNKMARTDMKDLGAANSGAQGPISVDAALHPVLEAVFRAPRRRSEDRFTAGATLVASYLNSREVARAREAFSELRGLAQRSAQRSQLKQLEEKLYQAELDEDEETLQS